MHNSAGGASRGVLWKDLCQWYLKQIEEELVDGEVYLQKQKVVDLVIRRMIKHENRIIEIEWYVNGSAQGVEVSKEEKRLKIHPSADV